MAAIDPKQPLAIGRFCTELSRMTLSNFEEKDSAVIYECLKCVASGEVIEHDWEFSTLFGLDASEFLDVLNNWPDIDASKDRDFLAINNAMANLLGYPHGKYDCWDEWMPYTRDEVQGAFSRWKERCGRSRY